MINILQIVVESESGKQKTYTIKNVQGPETLVKAKVDRLFNAMKAACTINGMAVVKLISAKITTVESMGLDLA